MSSNDLNEKPEPPQELQSRLADALISSSKKTRSSGSLLSTFASQMEVIDFEQLNKFNLSCPRDGCGSTILLKGVAKWDVKETVDPVIKCPFWWNTVTDVYRLTWILTQYPLRCPLSSIRRKAPGGISQAALWPSRISLSPNQYPTQMKVVHQRSCWPVQSVISAHSA